MSKQKLCVFTLYADSGASSRYRTSIYRRPLEEEFDVIGWYAFWNDTYVTKYMHAKKQHVPQILLTYVLAIICRLFQLYVVAPRADVVYIQKAVVPQLSPTFLRHLKKKNIRLVFDVDDAIYTYPKDNSSAIAQVVDLVICGNETLEKHYRNFTQTVVLPTTDETHLYAPYWSDTFAQKRIGWIGSRTTVPNLEMVVEPLNRLIEKHPEVSFTIISNDALDYPERIKNTHLVKWSATTYLKDLSELTVGIMPLEDIPFNYGKCGFKLVQYLSMKKPVVGTNIGVNGTIISQNGLTADNAEEWVQALETLLFDEETYRTCINHIEQDFFTEYHYDNVAQHMIEAIKASGSK